VDNVPGNLADYANLSDIRRGAEGIDAGNSSASALQQFRSLLASASISLARGPALRGRLPGAIIAVRQAAALAGDIPIENIGADEDLRDDLVLDALELESLGLILEEIFGIAIPAELWDSPLYRTSSSLAEWLIRKSEEAEWAEARRPRRHA
jgi:acyl carrier protein